MPVPVSVPGWRARLPWHEVRTARPGPRPSARRTGPGGSRRRRTPRASRPSRAPSPRRPPGCGRASGGGSPSRRGRVATILGPLRVVTAVAWPAGGQIGDPGLGRYHSALVDAAREQVARAAEVAREAAPGLEVEEHVAIGFPVPLLLSESRRASLVVIGWARSESAGRPFASLLLASPDGPGGALRYRGRVGTGFSAQAQAALAALMRPLARRTAPAARFAPALSPMTAIRSGSPPCVETCALAGPATIGP